MGIAFWTALALARPLRALQCWWQHPSRSPVEGLSSLPDDSYATPAPTSCSVDALASAPQTNQVASMSVDYTTHPLYFSSSILATPSRFRLPCSSTAHIALPKNQRISHCPTAAKNRETPKLVRTMRCSASMQEAGHFFIAGRMADVCAELDRLAAHEAAH